MCFSVLLSSFGSLGWVGRVFMDIRELFEVSEAFILDFF